MIRNKNCFFLFFISVYVLMIVVFLCLPFFSASGYSIVNHTTSQLGAQNTQNAWVMNSVFFLLGMCSLLYSFFDRKSGMMIRLQLAIFGISLFFVAVFRHAPIDTTISYDTLENSFHSLFATIAGFAFSFAAFFDSVESKGKRKKWISFCVGIDAILLSVLMGVLPQYAGIWQRLMFTISFGWLLWRVQAYSLFKL